jgi:AcrR family transcriptional regulator
MDDIAAAVDLNKGTLYHYYEGKASILFDIYMNASDEASAICLREPQDLPAEETLRRFVYDTLALIASKPSLASIYFQESPFLDEWLAPDQVAIIRKREDEIGAFVRGIIRRGIEEGSFRYTNARLAAMGIIGMVSWYYRWVSRSHGDTEEIAATFAESLLRGILK